MQRREGQAPAAEVRLLARESAQQKKTREEESVMRSYEWLADNVLRVALVLARGEPVQVPQVHEAAAIVLGHTHRRVERSSDRGGIDGGHHDAGFRAAFGKDAPPGVNDQ